MKIFLTGADGFVGLRAACSLEARGHQVIRVVRKPSGPGSLRQVVSDLTSVADWAPSLEGMDAVIHLAARAHVLKERTRDVQGAFDRANVDVTRTLAEGASRAGVRRFVFVSSIGVNGNVTEARPFREADEPAPTTAYARSKLAAERVLEAISRTSSLELVIVRPPLIYGPGAKGNLLRMLKLVHAGVPVPLASVRNRRTLIGIDDFCDVLALCAELDAAARQTFLIAEREARSTADIFRALYRGMDRRDRLFPFPELALRVGSRLVGLSTTYKQLCGSLEVDAAKAEDILGWSPRRPFEEGMREVAQWYLEQRALGTACQLGSRVGNPDAMRGGGMP